jgi:hypothetical protein
MPKDTDYICTHDEAQTYIKRVKPDLTAPNDKGTTIICRWRDERQKGGRLPVELVIAWPGSSTEDIYNLQVKKEWQDGSEENEAVADLNMLYLLKMSHRYLKNSPHFLKTMRDIQLMRALGATIEDADLLKKREKETYDYKHPSLMRNKQAFFNPNEGVKYIYDHDTLHLAMAVQPLTPAYTFFKQDQAEVNIDRSKWDNQPIEVQLNSVLEEATVLALERSQIPYRGTIDPRRSFQIALQKVCTSISSGWWRAFAWEYYDEVMAMFEAREAEKPYLTRFDEGIVAGIIQPFDGVLRHAAS